MERFHRVESTSQSFSPEGLERPKRRGARRSQSRAPLGYRVCDLAIEALLYFLVVFTPWAFGTTQPWSIWVANVVSYLIGGLWLAKWIIRWRTGFQPNQWGRQATGATVRDPDALQASRLTAGLAVLTALILGYTFLSAFNHRAIFLLNQNTRQYFDSIPWLPHSYDSVSTWKVFWNYIAWSLVFWATRDWLLGRSRQERQPDELDLDLTSPGSASAAALSARGQGSASGEPRTQPRSVGTFFPSRLKRLLWVLCVNGALVAFEGILQRLNRTDKLLWLVRPRWTDTDGLFGPYAYRSNAAAYLNLIWPVCLGFWFLLRKSAVHKHRSGGRIGGGSYVVLLPCAVVTAAAPVISTSRGGALVSIANLIGASALIFWAARRERPWTRAAMLSLIVAIVAFGGMLGWRELAQRLSTVFSDKLGNRIEIYDNSRPIAEQFKFLGTGPGTFASVYQLYKEEGQEWHAYLHDDWLETRITFGWIGFGLILLALGLVLARWFIPGGVPAPTEMVAFIWLALGGCLVHAKFDYPLQIYSITLLFLLLCAILVSAGRSEG